MIGYIHLDAAHHHPERSTPQSGTQHTPIRNAAHPNPERSTPQSGMQHTPIRNAAHPNPECSTPGTGTQHTITMDAAHHHHGRSTPGTGTQHTITMDAAHREPGRSGHTTSRRGGLWATRYSPPPRHCGNPKPMPAISLRAFGGANMMGAWGRKGRGNGWRQGARPFPPSIPRKAAPPFNAAPKTVDAPLPPPCAHHIRPPAPSRGWRVKAPLWLA